MIRLYHPNDLLDVNRIYEQYSLEFEMPNFNDYVCAFTIVKNDEIVSIGGVRNLLEAVVLTDKNKSIRIRHEALHQMLDVLKMVAIQNGKNEIHASIINDEKWKRHLKNIGFQPTKGEILVLSW